MEGNFCLSDSQLVSYVPSSDSTFGFESLNPEFLKEVEEKDWALVEKKLLWF